MASELERFIKTGKDNIDLLIDFSMDPDANLEELPEKVQEQYHDMVLLHDWMIKYKSKRLVIKKFLRRKKDSDPDGKGISEMTAYRRFHAMERVMGRLDRSDKEYKRAFMEEWFTRLLKKMEKAGEYRSIPAMARVLADVADLKATDAISDELLEAPIPMIVGDFPELVGDKLTREQADAIREKLRRKKKEEFTEDVDFEEVDGDE